MSYTTGSHTHTITYPFSHTHSISLNDVNEIAKQYYNNPIYDHLITKQEEPKMTTLDKVRAERQEARERLRIEQMYDDYDEQSLDTTEDGDVVRFTWSPEGREHPYTYAALFVAKKWYVTGSQAPNGLATEDFVAWLIGKNITVDDLVWLDARP